MQDNNKDWFKSKSRLIFLVVLFSKVFVTLFTIFQQYDSEVKGSFALCLGDYITYVEPIENLVNHGHYTPDFRMPGYGIFYLPLYFLFSKTIALNLLVIVQLVFDIVASF